MDPIVRIPILGLALAALLSGGCTSADRDERQPNFVLSADEIRLAKTLAGQALGIEPNAQSRPGHVVFVKVDLLPAADSERLVMVHHYRYEGDQTIFTMVDLRAKEVLSQEVEMHYPTALAPEEVERALTLARADERVLPVLQIGTVTMEVRPIQFSKAGDSLFGHRVAHVLLNRDGNYLAAPVVYVDLTSETVILQN
ncbi:MAG: hypothetical protein L0Y72_14945 [Gemmataceae bacterium]|nr:hypothetical protein [Gemmataceae bacterium]MCI0740340.1 hypothetical protein [Gemmataceae bacterium]